MRRFLIGGLAFFTMLGLCSFCLAETVGNPIDIKIPPGKGIYSARLAKYVSINIGYDCELLWGKDLNDGEDRNGVVRSTEVEMEGTWHMARISCTLFERVQPFLKIGVSDLQMKWNEVNEEIKAEAEEDEAFGVGAKILLLDIEKIGVKFTGDASYRTTKTKVNEVPNKTIYSSKFEIREWQAALALSKKFKVGGDEGIAIVPYVGGVYSDSKNRVRFSAGPGDALVSNPGGDGNSENFGAFVGCEALIADKLSLNLEGRFMDQTAASIGFTALF